MLKPKIFIVYAKEDSNMARKLYKDLKQEGIELWLDEEELAPGQDWDLEIQKAIRESPVVLTLISSNTVKKKGFTQKELKRALDIIEEKPEGSIYIIPVRIDDCQIDAKLQQYHWLDLFPSYSEGLRKLIRALKPDITTWDRR